jgi:phage tail-like protein
VSRPPHDPFKYRLDWRAGWRGETHGALTHNTAITPDDGAVALLPEPGTGAVLNDPSGSFGGLNVPDHVVVLPGGELILLDRARGMLRRLDPCCCQFEDWPCFGRDPHDPRVPVGAGGMAFGCGLLYIADPVGKRVLVLNHRSGVLRATWKSPSIQGLVEWQPTDVAIGRRSEVFVSDPANGAVHVFSARGVHRRFFGSLGAVRSLAVDCKGRVYVRVEGEPHVLVIDPRTGYIVQRPVRPEEVSSHFACVAVQIVADGAIDVSNFCASLPEPPLVVDITGKAVEQEPVTPTFAKEGAWVTQALDSEISRCVWHRVVLSGFVSARAAIDVYSLTSESEEPADLLALKPLEEWRYSGTWLGSEEVATAEREIDFLLVPPPGRYLWLKLVLRGDGTATPRVCAIEVEFPRISLRRYLPSIFGAEPVAADFTDRWLAIFDRTFRDVETVIDRQAAFFDPLACPDAPRSRDFLSWLAQWVGITLERNWPEARRRTYLKFAPRLFSWRGTVPGLRRTLYLFLGLERFLDYVPDRAECVPCTTDVKPGWRPPRLILEHFKLRKWMFLDQARLSDNAKLWGERIVNRSRLGGPSQYAVPDAPSGAQLGVTQLNKTQDPCRDPFHVYAHKLSVFVPASCVRNASLSRALNRLVALEKPAHVQAQVIPVEPRFRVGVQAMLGLDAVIGWRTPPVRLDETALAHGTVLTSAIDPRPRFRVGDARVGEHTVLP